MLRMEDEPIYPGLDYHRHVAQGILSKYVTKETTELTTDTLKLLVKNLTMYVTDEKIKSRLRGILNYLTRRTRIQNATEILKTLALLDEMDAASFWNITTGASEKALWETMKREADDKYAVENYNKLHAMTPSVQKLSD